MKLIMENWRTFVELSADNCGVLHLKENNTITEKSFTDQLSLISESNDEQINEFLTTWSESVDYALSQDILEEGVMDIVKQAASTLAKLGAKSWETVKSVSQKILGFVERFKENNPTIYKMIVGAVITVLSIGLFYLTAKTLDMNAVTTAMEQLASMQVPDVAISEIVRDFTSQGTVDALREAYQAIQEHVGTYIGEMIASEIDWVHNLGLKLQDMFGKSVEIQATNSFWEEMMQNAAVSPVGPKQ
jgi:hypothetical protein